MIMDIKQLFVAAVCSLVVNLGIFSAISWFFPNFAILTLISFSILTYVFYKKPILVALGWTFRAIATESILLLILYFHPLLKTGITGIALFAVFMVSGIIAGVIGFIVGDWLLREARKREYY